MTMNHFGRIAKRIGRNGFQSLLIQSTGRFAGKNDSVTELCKESEPEGVIFIHIEHSGYADGTFPSFCCGQRFIIKDAFQFVGIEIWHRIFWQRLAKPAFTTIACLVFCSIREFQRCNETMIATNATAIACAINGEGI